VAPERGAEHHTFSIVARCPATGVIGMAITSSPLSVAARCAWVRPGVGVIATQAYSQPALGPQGLTLLERGAGPDAVLKELTAGDPWREYRQVAVLAADGAVAAFTGEQNKEWKGHVARHGLVAMGNYLAGPGVVPAMVEAFERADAEIVEERLLRALEAGKAAGGEKGGQHSAGLIVGGSHTYPRTDLRVEWHDNGPGDDAVNELRRTFERYRPLIPYYEERPTHPEMPSWRDWLASRRT